MDKPEPRFDDLSAEDAWELLTPPCSIAVQTEALAALVYIHTDEHAKLAGYICRQLNELRGPGEDFELRHLLVCAAGGLTLSSRAVKHRLGDALLDEARNLTAKAHVSRVTCLLNRALRSYVRLRGPKALENLTPFLRPDMNKGVHGYVLGLVVNTLGDRPPPLSSNRAMDDLRVTTQILAQFCLMIEPSADGNGIYPIAYLAAVLLGKTKTTHELTRQLLMKPHDRQITQVITSALEEALESWRLRTSFEDARLIYLEEVCQRLRGRQSAPQHSTLQANEETETQAA